MLGDSLDEGRDPDDSSGETAPGTLYGKKRPGTLSRALFGE
jgi:hypothetical protein